MVEENKPAEQMDTHETAETVEPVQETNIAPEEAPAAEEKAAVRETDEAVERVKNWRDLRAAKERAEHERDEAKRELQQYGKHTRDEQEVIPDLTLNDDDLAEGKHLKTIKKQQDAFKRQQEQKLYELEAQLVEQKVKSQYPDFASVVTPDTLAMLKDADPELAESILANRNLQSQLVTAYRSIKRYGLSDGIAYEKNKEKAQYNASRPKPVASVSPQQGETPLSRANAFADGLTPDLQKQLWKEMQEIRKNS